MTRTTPPVSSLCRKICSRFELFDIAGCKQYTCIGNRNIIYFALAVKEARKTHFLPVSKTCPNKVNFSPTTFVHCLFMWYFPNMRVPRSQYPVVDLSPRSYIHSEETNFHVYNSCSLRDVYITYIYDIEAFDC